MKFSVLGFDQNAVISLSKTIKDKNGKDKTIQLDANDLLIINLVSDFMNRVKIVKYTIEDKTFFSIHYSVVIEDLPILNIKKQALSDRLDKIVELGVLEKKVVRDMNGTFTMFRMGERYEELKYRPTSSEIRGGSYQTTRGVVSDYEPKNNINNTITTNTIINKEDTIVSKKEEIDYDSVLAAWNEVASNVEALSKIRGLNDKRKNCIKNLIKNCKTSVEEIVKVINTIPYADDWVLGKGNRQWTIDFDFLVKNTNNWYVKALEGGLHKNNLEKFNEMMMNDGSDVCNNTNNSNSIKFQF